MSWVDGNFKKKNFQNGLDFHTEKHVTLFWHLFQHFLKCLREYVTAVWLIRVCLFQANNLGVGVVGVIECDFLQPTHNKQDFDYTKTYRYDSKLLLIIKFE